MDIKEIKDDWKYLAKEHFGINNDYPNLLFVGQINWKKNILRILEAVSLLKKDNINFNLILAGKGPHEKEIIEKAKELDIEDNIYMVGHILKEDLLYGLYSLAELFVFPSLYDTAALVVREAANACTPSIVVRNSAPAEIIDDGINGFLCEDDSNNLYEHIKKALLDIDNTRKIGIQAKETIPVAWNEILKLAIDRYQYLIDQNKS